MSAFDLIIFDCDGTLVDSETLNNQATSDVLAAIGLTKYTAEYCIDAFIGWNQERLWREVGRENNITLPGDMGARYSRRVAELRPTLLHPAPHIAEVLEKLSKTHKICIGSNGETENVCGAIKATKIDHFFSPEHIYVALDVTNPKPAPDLFLHAATRFGISPGRTLVIEDSVTGTKAGIAAGMTVFGYTGLSHKPKDETAAALSAAGAKVVSDNLLDILPFVA